MDKRVSDEPHTVVDRTACELRLEKGRRIGFAEYGAPEGQPVIVLHGTPGSRMLFESTDSVARKMGFRIVAPDRRMNWGMLLNSRDSRVLPFVPIGTETTWRRLAPAWISISIV